MDKKKPALAVGAVAALFIAFTAGFFAGRAGMQSAVSVERGGAEPAAPELVYVTVVPEPEIVYVTVAAPPAEEDAAAAGREAAAPGEGQAADVPYSSPARRQNAEGAPGAEAPAAQETSAAEPHFTADGRLRINYATAKELEGLPGIGPTLSQRIVDYRTAHGRFKTSASIKNVSGIGDGRYAQIRDLISAD